MCANVGTVEIVSMLNIGKGIKLAIVIQETSSKELAKDAGVAEITISKVIRGKMKPSLEILGKIAGGLNMKVSELVELGETKKRVKENDQ